MKECIPCTAVVRLQELDLDAIVNESFEKREVGLAAGNQALYFEARTAKEGSTSCSEDIPITGNVPNKHGFSL
jgi:hypothetical protein